MQNSGNYNYTFYKLNFEPRERMKEGRKKERDMEREPVSPTGRYLCSSCLNLYILAVFEMEVPIDNLHFMSSVEYLFSISPRFSSLMVTDKNGNKHWQRVPTNVEKHVTIPTFPIGLSPKSYDKYLDDYLSNLAIKELSYNKPLWEAHFIKYPTSNASGNVIIKLHHALGDGYSLIGALLSWLRRADNPSLPLTFPSRKSSTKSDRHRRSIFRVVPKFLSSVCNTIPHLGWSLLMSTVLEDDKTSIRSKTFARVDVRPITISTIPFSLLEISKIKSKLGVTVNDVISGAIFLGLRTYMQETMNGSGKEQSTAMVVFNTREIGAYKSVEEMVKKPNEKPLWGNQITLLHIPIPKIYANPLEFVRKTSRTIRKKRSTFAIHLTAGIFNIITKLRGPEATSRLVNNALTHSSLTISNLIGPVEQMALDGHRIKGFYFMVSGSPQSLFVTIMSYRGEVRIGIGAEKDFIDAPKLKLCIEKSFEIISQAAFKSS